MSQAQIHCRGCNCVFTPQGLSQHINRTQLPSCCALHVAIQSPTTHQTQGSNLVSTTGPTSWDHGKFANHLDTTGSVDCEDPAANCEDTAAEYEDAVADTVDTDLLKTLVQEFNCSTNDGQGLSASPDQPDQPYSSGSPPSGLALPLHSEPSDMNGPQLVVDRFPHGSPGAPIPGTVQGSHVYQSSEETFESSVWAPFRSQSDWEIAHWAKMHRPTSSAVTDILAIPRVVDKLNLLYCMPNELNKIIDTELPGRYTLEFYFRDILECIRMLYGDPEFAHDLVFAPECHYTNHKQKCCVYSKMHTGDWWWAVQTSLEAHRPGATVIPVIISSDKTQLTLFHAPIASHSETGIAMMSGDGVWHRCHPIFAMFVGDYPEQVLVTCTFNGRCPKSPLRDYDKASEAFLLADGDVRTFHSACHKTGLKPIFHPFWEALPLTDIFISITPNILHQMLQGVMKHLVKWLKRAF
ncbi:hypothetical protein EDB86DRAFT_2837195 [Lactarius hatsudake]|nr:hypothetical protein EDB86DRAFT_2837195 [Lactarius hatsudake]